MTPISQPEVLSQVHFPYVFIIDDFIRAAARQHPTFADDVSAVANTQCFPDIMVGYQNANVTFLEKLDNFLNINYGNGIDPCKRLIQQNETRLGCERAGNFDPAALSPDKLMAGLVRM